MVRNYRWLPGTIGSLYKWREASRNYEQPLGDEDGYQSAKCQGPRFYSCKEMYSTNNLNELESEFFPAEPPDENAARLHGSLAQALDSQKL